MKGKRKIVKVHEERTVSMAIIAATVAILAIGSTDTANPVQAQVQSMNPNPDGSCTDGWFQTPVGTCCPSGTMNIHNYCDTQEHHNQVTNGYIACLIAEAAQHIDPAQATIDCANGGGN